LGSKESHDPAGRWLRAKSLESVGTNGAEYYTHT